MKIVTVLLATVLAASMQAKITEHTQGYDAAIAVLDVDSGQWTRFNEKRCAERLSPCSTFKIPNSLIGLETGVVKSPDEVWKWDGVKREIDAHNRDHSMRTAFQESAVWYYQRLAAKAGAAREADFVSKFHYGNEDTSSGVANFWLGRGSLQISANEQVEFMRKFVKGELPVSKENLATVKSVMTIEADKDHTFGGKTGSGADEKTHKRNLNWFVGFCTKGEKTYVFATNLKGKDIQGRHTAERITKQVLHDLEIL